MKKKSYLLLLFWVVLSCSSESSDAPLTEGIQDSEEINTSSPVSGSESSTTEPSYTGRTGLSLGPNQMTVIAGSDVTPGDRIVFNETEYLVVDNELLREIVADQREDLSKIVTTHVTDMSRLFQNKQTLTPNISSWDTAQVTTMRSMFQGSTLYNGDISYWNTQSVTDFAYMFAQSGGFNQDIGSWNTGAASSMEGMFYQAAVFNRDLSKWCVEKISSTPSLFATESLLPQSYLPIWGTCPQ